MGKSFRFRGCTAHFFGRTSAVADIPKRRNSIGARHEFGNIAPHALSIPFAHPILAQIFTNGSPGVSVKICAGRRKLLPPVDFRKKTAGGGLGTGIG